MAAGVVVAESWLDPETGTRAGDFVGSFASSPPVFNISAKDVLFPTYDEKLLDALLKALNPPLVGALLGVVVGGVTGAKTDFAPPRADVDPNVGAAEVAFVGVFGEFVRENAEIGVGVSSVFLKNGDELGAPKLPKAPNPLAGLKDEGVVWRPLKCIGRGRRCCRDSGERRG